MIQGKYKIACGLEVERTSLSELTVGDQFLSLADAYDSELNLGGLWVVRSIGEITPTIQAACLHTKEVRLFSFEDFGWEIVLRIVNVASNAILIGLVETGALKAAKECARQVVEKWAGKSTYAPIVLPSPKGCDPRFFIQDNPSQDMDDLLTNCQYVYAKAIGMGRQAPEFPEGFFGIGRMVS